MIEITLNLTDEMLKDLKKSLIHGKQLYKEINRAVRCAKHIDQRQEVKERNENIVNLYKSGYTLQLIASKYGLAWSTIFRITRKAGLDYTDRGSREYKV